MGQVTLNGTILGGPAQVGSGFPQAIFSAQLGLSQNPKPFSAATGVLQRRVSVAAPSFAVLDGVGASSTVVHGDTLYFRSDSQLLLRISQVDPSAPSGSPLVRLLYVGGLVVLEFPTASQLVLLEAQGSATIEYAIAGQ